MMNKVEKPLKRTKDLEGIVVINKPSGMTSHDVVSRVRRIFRMKRVGHAGTLDPLATGVLVILLGKSTKLFSQFEGFDKAYRATMIFGKKTTTADVQGQIIQDIPYDHLKESQMKDALLKFAGEIDQVPPMVSAVKKDGKRLYELARKGIEVPREARKIRIDKLELLEFQLPTAKFYVECSKGTYVRQLAEDIAQAMGTVACISQIQRTKVGPYVIEQSVDLEHLTIQHVLSWSGK